MPLRDVRRRVLVTLVAGLGIACPCDNNCPTPPSLVALRADPGPVIDGYANRSIRFTGEASTTPDPPIEHWFWDFGDNSGVEDEGPRTSHTYFIAGMPEGQRFNFTVTLRIVDHKGNTATGTTTARITHLYPIGTEIPGLGL